MLTLTIRKIFPRLAVMEERNTLIKIRNGEQLVVPKRILIADSPVFGYPLDELNDDEHEFDDFSSQAVMLFIFLLENKQLEDIQDSMFRELHKLATIFKVKWLKDSCCEKKWNQPQLMTTKFLSLRSAGSFSIDGTKKA